MSQLDQLARHRDAILLAEAIGWLHDYRKCSEEQLQAQSVNTTAQGIAHSELTKRFSSLDTVSLAISSETESLPGLLNQRRGQAGAAVASFLLQYLSRCHKTAHFDKQDPLDSSKQKYPGTQISTAFGFETDVGAKLTKQLWALPWNNLTAFRIGNRNSLLQAVQTLFTSVGADTRRPINEISLWDWGMLVGALYKSAVAAVVLGHQLDSRDLRWQLLAVRTDTLAYLANVSRLPDLIARQNTLQTALDKVQTLLEKTYPLATEVYRDENGSLYVVPNLPNLLTLQDNSNQNLQTCIEQQFTIDGEIVPKIILDPTAWWGQDPNFDRKKPNEAYKHEIPPAGTILSSSMILQNDAAAISTAWQGKRKTICPVCGLRPCVSRHQDYCRVCRERRKGRVDEWLKDQRKTIWLDEVADSNGRLALIAGTFDLTNWLDGSLVETLLVQEPTANNSAVTKTPSFARLRRIWQTTQTFWQETQTNINQTLTDACRRLTIQLAEQPGLTPNQTYELDLQGSTSTSVLWNRERLISIDNLSYTAVQLGIKPEELKTPADAALAVGVWLEINKQIAFRLISDDEKNTQYDVQIASVDYQDSDYATAIPILAEPRTFMTFVPAGKALEVVKGIKEKYEREMGKVRNRLPLYLGIVYAGRHTPLRALMDAGRRMLPQGPLGGHGPWRVRGKAVSTLLPENKSYLARGTRQFEKTIHVELETNGRFLTWSVPAVMGDGITEDNWYPYVFLNTDSEPIDRKRRFQAPNPLLDGRPDWLVHASELEKGDKIYFTPAMLDWVWMDTTGRRFEIAYDETGLRLDPAMKHRPYLLDELETLENIWQTLSGHLTSTQIHSLNEVIEEKREAWRNGKKPVDGMDQVFHGFCRDAVANAEWRRGRSGKRKEKMPWEVEGQERDKKAWLDAWADYTAHGCLADVAELYMKIMKQPPERDKEA